MLKFVPFLLWCILKKSKITNLSFICSLRSLCLLLRLPLWLQLALVVALVMVQNFSLQLSYCRFSFTCWIRSETGLRLELWLGRGLCWSFGTAVAVTWGPTFCLTLADFSDLETLQYVLVFKLSIHMASRVAVWRITSTSVPGHFGPWSLRTFKRHRSDQGSKWPRTEVP